MYIIKCDRCGKEKVLKSFIPIQKPDPGEPTETPKYSIMKMVDEVQVVTLCKECEAEFDLWIRNYR